MNQLYASLIFLGIVLVVCAVIGILYDRKRSDDDARRLEEKKQELVEIINDADQMVEELNKFSEYIVAQVDLKRDELAISLKAFGERLEEEIAGQSCAQELKAAVNQGAVRPVEKKVIPLNSRYNDVIRLAREGMDHTQIAKNLGMGKGEIQLILELNR